MMQQQITDIAGIMYFHQDAYISLFIFMMLATIDNYCLDLLIH